MRDIQASVIFHALYKNVDGFESSSQAKKKNQHQDGRNTFVYGEFPFITGQAIIKKAQPKKDGVFFDLGSGVGRAVILSHLLFDFKKSVGIELLEGMHKDACQLQERLPTLVSPQFNHYLENREMSLLNRNIFDVDLSEADLILLNYPLRGEKSFLQLEEKFLRELKPKTKIIATIRKLKNPAFKLFHDRQYKFSWGMADTYFYEI